MNRMQKAAAAIMAVTITLAGATFVTAPLALANVRSVAIHQEAAYYQRVLACNTCAPLRGGTVGAIGR